ncbi:MAG: hypothetical protein ACREX0_12900 [Noviherbaspirillum sp.]
MLKEIAANSDAILATYRSALKNELAQQLFVPLVVMDALKIIGYFAPVRLAERTLSPAAERFIAILKESLEPFGAS